MLIFAISMLVASLMSIEELERVDDALHNPSTIITIILTFMLALFTNNCYDRFQRNWESAMIGWSRLNDLGLQIYAYLRNDRKLACEVLRYMHASNHLFYADMANKSDSGGSMIDVVKRRHLLTDEEASQIEEAGAPAPFYQCCCWALELVAQAGINEVFVLDMSKSIIEWRQSTTLIPLSQQTPLPLPYYSLMVFMLLLFEVLFGLRMAITANNDRSDRTKEEGLLPHAVAMSYLASGALFFLISLIAHSLLWTSISLLEPWSKNRLRLPTDEHLLLPLVSHRNLFNTAVIRELEQGGGHEGAAEGVFLRPFGEEDNMMLKSFGMSETMKIRRQMTTDFQSFFSGPSVLGHINVQSLLGSLSPLEPEAAPEAAPEAEPAITSSSKADLL